MFILVSYELWCCGLHRPIVALGLQFGPLIDDRAPRVEDRKPRPVTQAMVSSDRSHAGPLELAAVDDGKLT